MVKSETAIAGAAAVGCAPDGRKRPELATSSANDPGRLEILFAVKDMHCATCISTIEKSLSELPEVLSARVNLTRRRVRIEAVAGTDASKLLLRLEQVGYSAVKLDAEAVNSVSTDPEAQGLLVRLGVAGFGFANVMIFSIVVWSGAEGTTRDLMHWLSALIATPIICYSARPFFVSAVRSLRRFRLNMDVPISLAIMLAVGQSLFEMSLGGQHAYFEAALALTFFLLAGRYLDLRTRAAVRSAAQQLSALEPDSVTALRNGKETEVPLVSVGMGDMVVVRAGDRIPLDGVVRFGSSEVDNSFLTGESRPISAGLGDLVSAGQFVHTGRLAIEVTGIGENSSLRRLVKLIELAESTRNRYTNLADKAAAIYAPAVHLLALIGFAGWMVATGDVRLSLNIAVAVLIITCPCALGLAVPAVSTAAIGRLFRSNLLIKSPDAIERLADVRTAILDKTGTLTKGTPRLEVDPAISDKVLSVARGLAEASQHPYARAILKHIRSKEIDVADVQDVREVPGYGIIGIWQGQEIRLGCGLK